MNFNDLNRRATSTINSVDVTPRIVNDAMFSAIRDLQESTLCSKMKVVKQCPSSSYTVSSATKAATGIVTLTLSARHYIDPGQEITVANVGAAYNGTFNVMGGGTLGETYDENTKIQYTFGSASAASAATGSVTVPAQYVVKINPFFEGIDHDRDTASTDAAKVNKFKVVCLSVDNMWIINSDLTKNRVNVMSSNSRQVVRDSAISGDGDIAASTLVFLSGATQSVATTYGDVFYASLDFEKNAIILESTVDMAGKQVEFWLRYAIPYIQDANVASVLAADGSTPITLMDSLIQTIPDRFHERLVRGVKYKIYDALSEMDPKYDGLRQKFQVEWMTLDIPFVQQEANKHVSRELTDEVVPKGVFSEWL